MGPDTTPIVRMRDITKRFGGVLALQNVDFEAYSNEVVCIVGDNGAGKSTLIKILTGVYQPTEGKIELDGAPFTMSDHSDAIAAGIDAVYQNLAIADHLTPAQNLFLGSELTKTFLGFKVLDNARMEAEAAAVLRDRLGVQLRDMGVATKACPADSGRPSRSPAPSDIPTCACLSWTNRPPHLGRRKQHAPWS